MLTIRSHCLTKILVACICIVLHNDFRGQKEKISGVRTGQRNKIWQWDKAGCTAHVHTHTHNWQAEPDKIFKHGLILIKLCWQAKPDEKHSNNTKSTSSLAPFVSLTGWSCVCLPLPPSPPKKEKAYKQFQKLVNLVRGFPLVTPSDWEFQHRGNLATISLRLYSFVYDSGILNSINSSLNN